MLTEFRRTKIARIIASVLLLALFFQQGTAFAEYQDLRDEPKTGDYLVAVASGVIMGRLTNIKGSGLEQLVRNFAVPQLSAQIVRLMNIRSRALQLILAVAISAFLQRVADRLIVNHQKLDEIAEDISQRSSDYSEKLQKAASAGTAAKEQAIAAEVGADVEKRAIANGVSDEEAADLGDQARRDFLWDVEKVKKGADDVAKKFIAGQKLTPAQVGQIHNQAIQHASQDAAINKAVKETVLRFKSLGLNGEALKKKIAEAKGLVYDELENALKDPNITVDQAIERAGRALQHAYRQGIGTEFRRTLNQASLLAHAAYEAIKAAVFTSVRLVLFNAMRRMGEASARLISDIGATLAFQFAENYITRNQNVLYDGKKVDTNTEKGREERELAISSRNEFTKQGLILNTVSDVLQLALSGTELLQDLGIVLSSAANRWLAYKMMTPRQREEEKIKKQKELSIYEEDQAHNKEKLATAEGEEKKKLEASQRVVDLFISAKKQEIKELENPPGVSALILEGMQRALISRSLVWTLDRSVSKGPGAYTSPLDMTLVLAYATGIVKSLFIPSANVFTPESNKSARKYGDLPALEVQEKNNIELDLSNYYALKNEVINAKNFRLHLALKTADEAIIEAMADYASFGRSIPHFTYENENPGEEPNRVQNDKRKKDKSQDIYPGWELSLPRDPDAFYLRRYVDFTDTAIQDSVLGAQTDALVNASHNQAVDNLYAITSGKIRNEVHLIELARRNTKDYQRAKLNIGKTARDLDDARRNASLTANIGELVEGSLVNGDIKVTKIDRDYDKRTALIHLENGQSITASLDDAIGEHFTGGAITISAVEVGQQAFKRDSLRQNGYMGTFAIAGAIAKTVLPVLAVEGLATIRNETRRALQKDLESPLAYGEGKTKEEIAFVRALEDYYKVQQADMLSFNSGGARHWILRDSFTGEQAIRLGFYNDLGRPSSSPKLLGYDVLEDGLGGRHDFVWWGRPEEPQQMPQGPQETHKINRPQEEISLPFVPVYTGPKKRPPVSIPEAQIFDLPAAEEEKWIVLYSFQPVTKNGRSGAVRILKMREKDIRDFVNGIYNPEIKEKQTTPEVKVYLSDPVTGELKLERTANFSFDMVTGNHLSGENTPIPQIARAVQNLKDGREIMAQTKTLMKRQPETVIAIRDGLSSRLTRDEALKLNVGLAEIYQSTPEGYIQRRAEEIVRKSVTYSGKGKLPFTDVHASFVFALEHHDALRQAWEKHWQGQQDLRFGRLTAQGYDEQKARDKAQVDIARQQRNLINRWINIDKNPKAPIKELVAKVFYLNRSQAQNVQTGR